MPSTKAKPQSKFKSIALTTFIIVVVTSPVWLLGLGILVRLMTDTVSIRENVEHDSRYPFLNDISSVWSRDYAYREGTVVTSWTDVKKHFKDFEWQQIDEEEGIIVQCYKFSKTHPSQVESRTQGKYNGFLNENAASYDHKISHGFFAIRGTGSVMDGHHRIVQEVYYDSENNRFFYIWQCMW